METMTNGFYFTFHTAKWIRKIFETLGHPPYVISQWLNRTVVYINISTHSIYAILYRIHISPKKINYPFVKWPMNGPE